MRRSLGCALAVTFGAAMLAAQAPAGKGFRSTSSTSKGGNATLFVSPSGGSVLIDTGNGGQAAARDTERIMAASRMPASPRSIT